MTSPLQRILNSDKGYFASTNFRDDVIKCLVSSYYQGDFNKVKNLVSAVWFRYIEVFPDNHNPEILFRNSIKDIDCFALFADKCIFSRTEKIQLFYSESLQLMKGSTFN